MRRVGHLARFSEQEDVTMRVQLTRRIAVRLVAVTWIVLVAGIMIQNALHAMKVSERRDVNAAADVYSAVRSMYAERTASSTR